jgi:SpoVK/Ycf46/Vps4 family AAA+-type ATPase
VVAQLQVELDGLARLDDVFVIAETNRLDAVDTAILRAGRLGVHLAVNLPTRDERSEIIRILCRQLDMGDELSEATSAELADMTDGFSGADLAQVLREVASRNTGGEGVEHALLVGAVARRRQSLVALGQSGDVDIVLAGGTRKQ